jgi:DNA polymerase V
MYQRRKPHFYQDVDRFVRQPCACHYVGATCNDNQRFSQPGGGLYRRAIDLVAHLISHPSATYVLRTASDAMCGAAILPGSLLLVDSSLQPVDGDIVVARLLSGFTVRRLRLSPPRLVAENENYRTVYIDEEEGAHIVGVVTTIITTPRRTLHVRAASVRG